MAKVKLQGLRKVFDVEMMATDCVLISLLCGTDEIYAGLMETVYKLCESSGYRAMRG